MKIKLSNLIIVVLFGIFIAGLGIAHFLVPDASVSAAERRKLAQKPEFSLETLVSGKFTTKAEDYLADQFPLRQQWRTVKAAWQFGAFRQKDNDGIYIVDGSVYKLTGKLDEAQVNALVNKVNSVYEKYLAGMKVYFAAIPDKSADVAPTHGYPTLDYGRLDALLKEGLDGSIDYLGFSACHGLTHDDYYKTDLHWRQETLQPVVTALGAAMDFKVPDISSWQVTEHAPFYGVYCGQSALDVGWDTIKCLFSPAVDVSRVTGLDFKGEKTVYDSADLESLDGYDIFLGGPKTVETVVNPNGTTGRELYVFRDSFASALTPLLLESYDKITLIDLRYVASDLLEQFVTFTPGADVLFMYSTEILNSGMLLK